MATGALGGGDYGAASRSASELETAYEALGLEAKATDAEVKRRYRKLMSEHHPDKLIAEGCPMNSCGLPPNGCKRSRLLMRSFSKPVASNNAAKVDANY